MASFPKPQPDDAPCRSCSNMVYSSSKAMCCSLCQAWFHIECVDIQESAYQLLESMKGSVWLYKSCEEGFSDLQGKLDILSIENAELKSRLKEMEELTCMITPLKLQVESLSKDLHFLMSCDSSHAPAAMSKAIAPPIQLSNRFVTLSQLNPKPATPSAESANPSKAGSLPPLVCTRNSMHDVTNSPAASAKGAALAPPATCNNLYPKLDSSESNRQGLPSQSGMHRRFFIRGVQKVTTMQAVKDKLASFGVSQEQLGTLQQPASLIPTVVRKFLSISLDVPMANRVDKALKAEKSLGWFIGLLPPKGPNKPLSPHRGPLSRNFPLSQNPPILMDNTYPQSMHRANCLTHPEALEWIGNTRPSLVSLSILLLLVSTIHQPLLRSYPVTLTMQINIDPTLKIFGSVTSLH